MIELSFRLMHKNQKTGQEISLKKTADLKLISDFTKQVDKFLKGNEFSELEDLEINIYSGSLGVLVRDSKEQLKNIVQGIENLKHDYNLSSIKDEKRADVLKTWQNSNLIESNDSFYEIKSKYSKALSKIDKLIISNKTKLQSSTIWVDVELYYNGHIYDMGGKKNPNIHIELDNGEPLIIKADKKILSEIPENKLYTNQIIRVKAKQSLQTKALKDFEFISFESKYNYSDPKKYEKLAKKGAKAWGDVENASEWVERQRGNIP